MQKTANFVVARSLTGPTALMFKTVFLTEFAITQIAL